MIKRFFLRVYYASAIGTILQRLEWKREHSSRYRIKKIKNGLKTGDQNRSMFFDKNYSGKARTATTGYEYHYDYPNTNREITQYFQKRGYTVENSKFGKNLFIYKP